MEKVLLGKILDITGFPSAVDNANGQNCGLCVLNIMQSYSGSFSKLLLGEKHFCYEKNHIWRETNEFRR